jgi:SAM-dependent methyltransferase
LDEVNFIGDEYKNLEGHVPEADLGLGCGIPTQFANIKAGNTVIDLGSGAGNDAFVARSIVGSKGEIIGVDFTPAMIEKARKNAEKLGFDNVNFVEGDIEKIPLADESADVVVSNCVLNLVPDKSAAFNEIHRILNKEGHFSISDVVIKGDLPDEIKESAEMYVGCVSGALNIDSYLEIIESAGFQNIAVQQQRKIDIPKDLFESVLNPEQLEAFLNDEFGIYSINVYGEKNSDCCDSSCCN